MERLTGRYETGLVFVPQGMMPEALDRLAYYEDMEEQGRLMVLPCKVGDTVWMIVTKRPKITMPEYSFIKRSRLTWYNMERVLRCFGKTVFLTREEAKQALNGGAN